RSLWATNCSVVVSLSCLVGVILALVALFRWPWRSAAQVVERLAGVALLAYVVAATASEQFAWVWEASGIVIAVAWLSPLAGGGMILPCRGCWIAGVGCWCVLFGGTGALTYSATHAGSGVGLFFAWLA